jgi:NarL family two-component system response regulator LiaR
MTEKIRILICDDHAIIREGLRALIGNEQDLEVVGEASNGLEGVQKSLLLKPDVILMDMVMPRMNGLEAIVAIMHEQPEAHILVLTSFMEDEKIFPAIKAGAMGYVLKDALPQELLGFIRDVAAGELTLHPAVARKVINEMKRATNLPPTSDPLTERESEVLALVAKGATNQDIADKLMLTERTVRTYVSNILSKLHLANRTQAALYAIRSGLVKPEDGKSDPD